MEAVRDGSAAAFVGLQKNLPRQETIDSLTASDWCDECKTKSLLNHKKKKGQRPLGSLLDAGPRSE